VSTERPNFCARHALETDRGWAPPQPQRVPICVEARAARSDVIQTALASTTISGYVDTSAQWNFGTGNQHLPDYKFGGPTKADGFNLDVVQLRIEKPLDEAEWAAGYRVDLWFGPDANVLGTQSTGETFGSSDFAIRKAYMRPKATLVRVGSRRKAYEKDPRHS
jgi:putative OmpL-like beta-barrel porin-2